MERHAERPWQTNPKMAVQSLNDKGHQRTRFSMTLEQCLLLFLLLPSRIRYPAIEPRAAINAVAGFREEKKILRDAFSQPSQGDF